MASGIHHVTAIAGSPHRNLDFYTRTLGLRLVKKTVNFDDPSTYHFYYGDEAGHPGTILTFFPWEHAEPGRLGIGEAQETVFAVPEASIGYWAQRFVEKGVAHERPIKRFGETVLAFRDLEGMRLAVVGVKGLDSSPSWEGGGVPSEYAIRGLHSISLLISDGGPTAEVLTNVFGFQAQGSEATTHRYRAQGVRLGGLVDLRAAGGFLAARQGAGSVHHVAFRAADDAAQAAMAETLRRDFNLSPTEQKDRKYFRSVYFREPGGVMFEIATDAPGFAVDEGPSTLGQALKLPPFLEPRRAAIAAALPDVG